MITIEEATTKLSAIIGYPDWQKREIND